MLLVLGRLRRGTKSIELTMSDFNLVFGRRTVFWDENMGYMYRFVAFLRLL